MSPDPARAVPFILASASPRRKQLLADAGYEFSVIPSGFDESGISPDGLSSGDYATKLALCKAMPVADENPDSYVVGADTVVDFDGDIIGKAEDEREAERILKRLFSKPHRVITGLAIVKKADNIKIGRFDSTTIYPAKIGDYQIAFYIESGNWQGKAGAYGIQKIGDEFVERIEGSFSNVVGMPMELFAELIPSR